MTKEALKLALGYVERNCPALVFKEIKEALAQPVQEPPSEWAGIKAILDEYGLQAIDFVADFKAALAQPEQEPVARCCLHDSDCAVHNMPAYPAGACDCSQTFVSSPDLGIVTTVAYQLAVRELAKLVENNFGRMPRNDKWADKVLLVRDTFEAAHNIKEGT